MDKLRKLSKFILLSLMAIIIFFVPIKGSNCLVVLLCTYLKTSLMNFSKIMVFVLLVLEVIQAVKKRSILNFTFCCISIVILGISCFTNGYAVEVIDLAFSIIITVFISGTLSVFITESGLVEFIATFLEKYMRKFLKVPGNAAMDIITSFFASSSVGVFITSKYYREKIYTQKEAFFIASNFSVVSFGFLYGIIAITRLEDISNYIVFSVIILNFIIGAIMIRIYPLSKVSDALIDGKKRENEIEKQESNRVLLGIERGKNKADSFGVKVLLETAKRTMVFCQEIMIQVIPMYFFALLCMNYTNVFEWLGKPFEIILNFLRIPDATAIAPATFMGIFEVSLPAIYISGMSLSIEASFFVTVLSLIQIIFFTETANAILQSDIPAKISDLVKIFIIRTLLAMPMLALIIHIIF